MRRFRFPIALKLMVVCLAFGLPIVVMFMLMTQAKLTEIRFAEQEMRGDQLQRPLEQVLQHVGRHRRSWLAQQRGDALAASELVSEERAVARALGELERTEREVGEALQFTREGLGLRGRLEFTSLGLQRKWRALVVRLASSGYDETEQSYREISTHIRTMVTHSGDASNLILDPDLDSYYLMDVTLLVLPQMEERLQYIGADVERLLRQPRLSTNDKVHVAKSVALLREADWNRAAASARTALIEDPNFHGVSQSLAPALRAQVERCERASAALFVRLEGLAAADELDAFDRAAFRTELGALDDAIYDFHGVAFDEEDTLLRLRIADFRASLVAGYWLAALSVALSSILAFLVASNVVRRVRKISAATEAFARGQMAARVGKAGADEIGDLATSFDRMADHIGSLTVGLENRVEERTRALTKRNQEFKLILDNAHDGMLTTDLAGQMSSERSAAVERWFGTPSSSLRVFDYLAGQDQIFAASLGLGLEEIRDGIMPLDLLLDQLPRRLRREGRDFQLSYQPIREGDGIGRLLVVVSDVTSELQGRRAAADQQEIVRVFQACQQDRVGFLEFFGDARALLRRLGDQSASPGDVRRAIHTLKGNASLFGVTSISELCHEIETNMAEGDGSMSVADRERLQLTWNRLAATVKQTTGDDTSRKIEIAEEDFTKVVKAIAAGTERQEILRALAEWKLEPASRRLERFAEQARGYALRISKQVGVSVQPDEVRLCAETWAPVWSSLIHLIRNAIDHGLEGAEERLQGGKPPAGSLMLRTTVKGGRALIEVSDDGRGVQWDAVREKARLRELPAATREDLVEALFADGLSTREVVTELSGRGVGMSAVREAVHSLGGRVEVESQPGRGTTVRCSFPESVMAGRFRDIVAVSSQRPAPAQLRSPGN